MTLLDWICSNKNIRNIAKHNGQYFLVGILIGTFVNIIFQLLAGVEREWKTILTTYVVSIIITLCISNITIVSSRIIKRKFKSPFVNILLNYSLMSLGVLIGTGISYLFIVLLYDISFSELNHVRNLKINFTLGFLVFTIINLYLLQRDNYTLKIKDKEVELLKLNELKTQADLKSLQARINPHFLYNALNSITSLIHDEPAKAEEMTVKLSLLFRYSLNTQDANWATVNEELEIVKTYLDIERIRFESRISFIIEADQVLLNEMMPRFLLQPLVENALKHGLKDKSIDGILRIQIVDKDELVEVNIYDNGIPFPTDFLAGYGLQSTYDKLNLLYKDNWKMEYLNTPEKRVSIRFPKKRKA